MFELRVLSGLHRGAALPLIGAEWLVGAHDDADLALYDPGVCARHVRVSGAAGAWMVERLDGGLADAQGTPHDLLEQVLPNRMFAVAGIWLCIVPAEQAWPDDVVLEPVLSSPEPIDPKIPLLTISGPRPSLSKRIAIALCIVTVASSTLALTQRSSDVTKPSEVGAQPQNSGKRIRLASAEEVARELDRMLAERELASYVRIAVRDDQVVLSGEVPPQRLSIAARMLERFRDRFETSIVLANELQERKAQLPFQIVQIVGGKQGHVVTSTGRRLFLGDQIDGMRLTAIEQDKVSFDGDQRYEVNW